MRSLYVVELCIIAVVVTLAAVMVEPLRTPAGPVKLVSPPVNGQGESRGEVCRIPSEAMNDVAADRAGLSDGRVVVVGSQSFQQEGCRRVCGSVVRVLDQCGVQVRRVSLDGQPGWSEQQWLQAARRVWSEAESFRPAVMIVTGEPAWEYVAQRMARERGLAVVFCDVERMDLSESARPMWATGMAWSPQLVELVQALRPYAGGGVSGC